MRRLPGLTRFVTPITAIVTWGALGWFAPALGQRVSFPTPVANDQPVYTTQLPSTSPPGSTFATPAVPYTAPATPTPSLPPATSPTAIPPYGAPAPGSFGAPQAAPYAAAPFDPYATPTTTTLGPAYGGPTPTYQSAPGANAIKLCQEIRLQNTYLPRFSDSTGFGVTDTELYASFGFPLGNMSPILVTPGFNFHFWDGPATTPGVPNDLPGTVFDAYLATSWRPQFTPKLGADLAVSMGVYTDFTFVDSQSFRVLGRGLGLYTLNPNWQIAVGVLYLNRMSVKLLPAGGAIWTPHADARYELLFPNPKLSQRLTTIGQTDLWGYLAGEYGGGQWTVKHADGSHDLVNYNDIRLLLGIDWFRAQRMRGNVEIGYVFNRQILYYNSGPTINPSDTMSIRAGISY